MIEAAGVEHLDELLASAAVADGLTRIELGNDIASFGIEGHQCVWRDGWPILASPCSLFSRSLGPPVTMTHKLLTCLDAASTRAAGP